MNVKRICLVVILVFLLLLCACATPIEQEWESAISKYRPEAAMQIPDVSGEITNVRVTAVERKTDGDLPLYEGYTLVQTYYGYEVDGQWYDFPAENYDLRSWYTSTFQCGYAAAAANMFHMVQIGKFLIVRTGFIESADELGVTMTDTIGTQMIQPFENYACGMPIPTNSGKYAYLIEDRNSISVGKKYEFEISYGFPYFCYLIVDTSQMTDTYEILVTQNTLDGRLEWVLPRDEIDSVLHQEIAS